MWRNVSWNSTDSSLPEGMHKHETGAYFKTPAGELARRPASPVGALDEKQSGPEEGSGSEQVAAERQQLPGEKSRRGHQSGRLSQRASSNSSNSTQGRPATSTGSSHPANFRARLSSISGALQHPPRLAKRLFAASHHQEEAHQPVPVQITTTSIDSPQHQPALGPHPYPHPHPHGHEQSSEHARAPLASGRRLSQLFLPQLNQALQVDPFGQTSELFPAHLLGLYGQPPLIGGGSGATSAMLNGLPMGAGGPRASWADISLLGRLPNVRPSIDSAFYGPAGGQMRLSFDARKYFLASSM